MWSYNYRDYHETWIGSMVMHWFDISMVMGSNLSKSKLNFLFAKILFGMNVKG